MKLFFTCRPFFILLLLNIFIFCEKVFPQNAAPDTLRTIQILQGKNLRERKIDSVTSFQTIAGNVILKEGLTIFTCDSAAINKSTNVMEAFGNIHINQQDSIHTYSQYLRYVGSERIAYLKKEVRLTDKKGILYTQDLEYGLKTGIGKYKGGGRVVNGKTTLTSKEGTYYADTKDVFFKKDVHLVDPKYDIRSDSLQYNTLTQAATFITATFIKSKQGGDIYTTSGNYDLKNGKAFFGNRSIIKDSTRTYVADNSAYDEKSGIAQLEGNAVIKDSVNGYTVLGNQIYVNRDNESFLATRKPVLIFKGEGKDSTFIAADTLFSGVESRDSIGKRKTITADTLKKTTVINSDQNIPFGEKTDSSFFSKNIRDTLPQVAKPGSLPLVPDKIILTKDSLTKDESDSTIITQNKIDSSINKAISDTVLIKKENSKPGAADTIRYFLAFHHVRIFNDSLQAVCDSLYYSSEDSLFRLFTEPLVFSNQSQVAGDTIFLYTKNKKADRIFVFDQGILINKINSQMYNQIQGRTLNGYFKEGAMDYMRAKGQPAESIFYPQDDDSAFTGMNFCKGDLIDIYFVDKAVNKVKFINEVDGTLYPIRQIPEDKRYLKLFKWQDARRPKNKFELFE